MFNLYTFNYTVFHHYIDLIGLGEKVLTGCSYRTSGPKVWTGSGSRIWTSVLPGWAARGPGKIVEMRQILAPSWHDVAGIAEATATQAVPTLLHR